MFSRMHARDAILETAIACKKLQVHGDLHYWVGVCLNVPNPDIVAILMIRVRLTMTRTQVPL